MPKTKTHLQVSVFDIETGPRPIDEIKPLMPEFTAPANWKDEEKIDREIRRKQIDWIERAALSPITGRTLAIGFADERETTVYGFDGKPSERAMLNGFWMKVFDDYNHGNRLVGFNIRGFDLPFLVRRSYLLGVDIPKHVIDSRGYWSSMFVDLLTLWQCGDRSCYVKLDDLCKAFGLPGKTEGVTGADFSRLWDEDRQAALNYLEDDLAATIALAKQMGAM